MYTRLETHSLQIPSAHTLLTVSAHLYGNYVLNRKSFFSGKCLRVSDTFNLTRKNSMDNLELFLSQLNISNVFTKYGNNVSCVSMNIYM